MRRTKNAIPYAGLTTDEILIVEYFAARPKERLLLEELDARRRALAREAHALAQRIENYWGGREC